MPSFVQYTSLAGQVNYPINTIDGWLSPTFLKVYIDGVLKSVTTDYTLQTVGVTPTIVLNTAPTTGSIVRIARDTPKTVSSFQGGVVDFQDASILTAQDLDNAVVGLLHISQEGADTGSGALGPTLDGTAWDANSKRITAVSAPSDPGDAATKNYVDTLSLYLKAQTVPQDWEFTASAGQTSFNLSATVEPAGTVPEMYLVTVDGLMYPPDEYQFAGGKSNISLVFNTGLTAGDKVRIRNFGVARAVADALTPGSITNLYLATDAVTADKIAADAVTTVKINTGAVTEAKIGAGAVTNAKLAALAVQTANISNGAVTLEKISNGAVDTEQLATGAVTNIKIEDGTIGTAKLSTSVTVSTLSSPGSALDMNAKKITNLGAPTAPTDAATRQFVLDNAGGGLAATGRTVIDFPIGTCLLVTGTNVGPSDNGRFWSGLFLDVNVPINPPVGTNNLNTLQDGTGTASRVPFYLYVTNSFYRSSSSSTPPANSQGPLTGTWVSRGCVNSTGVTTATLMQRIA